MTLLKLKAREVVEQTEKVLNLAVSQAYSSLGAFGRMDQGDLEGLKAVNELMVNANSYLLDQAEAQDDMTKKLDELEKDMREVNRKLNLLLEKVERKEEKP